MPMEDPNMGGEMPMNGQDPMMNGEEMPMDEPMMNDGMGDESKKEIQQLSGKLSQELMSYNQNQNEPDSELNKYVAGMIIPQATKAMSASDKDEIVKKINDGSSNDVEDDNMDMPMESKFNLDNIINEIIGSVLNQNDENKNREEKKVTNKKVTNKNPFVSNR